MKVLFASVEVSPFAWTGGLGDVAGSLPLALAKMGVDVRVIMPKLSGVAGSMPEMQRAVESVIVHMPWWVSGCAIDEGRLPYSDVPVYFIEHNQYFDREFIYGPPNLEYTDNLERFTFFCRAVFESFSGLQWQPDIIHMNDWHTSLIAWYRNAFGLPFRTVYTAHQLGEAYHGMFADSLAPLAGVETGRSDTERFVRKGALDLARLGFSQADQVNTVSERYAWEVTQPWSEETVWDLIQERSEHFCGIVNGINYSQWNPATDPNIAANYSLEDLSGKAACKAYLQNIAGLEVNPEIPLIGMVTRLDELKGFDLVAAMLPAFNDAQFVILGFGDPVYSAFLNEISAARPNIAAFIEHNPALARQIYAGCDMFLMPSRREPCGLAQMISLAYGTLPIVHFTGGLADTISEIPEGQNGFVFHTHTADDMTAAIHRATGYFSNQHAWHGLVQNALRCDFSWERSARKYIEMYERALR